MKPFEGRGNRPEKETQNPSCSMLAGAEFGVRTPDRPRKPDDFPVEKDAENPNESDIDEEDSDDGEDLESDEFTENAEYDNDDADEPIIST
ncbi:MAG: hypothetical protein ACD_76C00147G0007 [uncultured bacterium]|nr:MAG: hypothetical protein ACD_76C00147G0007 [uncultured bacterium]HBD05438.1 hypothetical protein [Candidatus Uhrbacteria bacterium]